MSSSHNPAQMVLPYVLYQLPNGPKRSFATLQWSDLSLAKFFARLLHSALYR